MIYCRTKPLKLGLETCQKWMHELGFEVVVKKKGTFVDGHERSEYRNLQNGFFNSSNAPTDKTKQALPSNIEPTRPDLLEKTVILFHDETTFTANSPHTPTTCVHIFGLTYPTVYISHQSNIKIHFSLQIKPLDLGRITYETSKEFSAIAE